MGEQQQHPSWCDPTQCSVERASSPFYTHSSRQFLSTIDPDSGIGIALRVWKFLGRHTYVMFEFVNDCCEGHEITPHQARELYDALGAYLAEFEPNELATVQGGRAG